MKLSEASIGADIAHILDEDDLSPEFVGHISACATAALSKGLNGHYDSTAVHKVLRQIKRAKVEYRRFMKEHGSSFGPDTGPSNLPVAIGDYRIFWEAPQPESVDISIDQLVQSLIDRGHSQADAMATARRVVQELPPPDDVTKLDTYRGRAFKRALEIAPQERLVKNLWGGF